MAEEEFVPGGIEGQTVNKDSFQGKIIPKGESDPAQRESLKQAIADRLKQEKPQEQIPGSIPPKVENAHSAEANLNARKMLVAQEAKKMISQISLDEATKETLGKQLNQVMSQLSLGDHNKDLEVSKKLAEALTQMAGARQERANQPPPPLKVEQGTLRVIKPGGEVSKPIKMDRSKGVEVEFETEEVDEKQKYLERDSLQQADLLLPNGKVRTVSGKVVEEKNGARGIKGVVLWNEKEKTKTWVPTTSLRVNQEEQKAA